MPRKISNPNKGMRVHVTPQNTKKLITITKATGRSVATEANVAITKYKPKR